MEETVAVKGLSSQITKAHTSFGFNCTDFRFTPLPLEMGWYFYNIQNKFLTEAAPSRNNLC